MLEATNGATAAVPVTGKSVRQKTGWEEDYKAAFLGVSEENQVKLVKTFAGEYLFHHKKYFFDSEYDFSPKGKTYQLMFRYAGIDPLKLNDTVRDKKTKDFRDIIKSVIGSRRSTVVDAMKKKYLGTL